MLDQPGRYRRRRDLFEALLELAPAAREDRLAVLDDASLADEVRELLAWHEREAPFLDGGAPAAIVATAAAEPPTWPCVEPYRLEALLGRGGMGSVYRAERADGLYKKPVAIKILDHAPDNAPLVARFRAERQILAQLEHPNIAKLLDGGTTVDGRPFFVMELIEGLPLDRFCEQHRLSLRQRLQLLLKACSAVRFAHQNLIVHRDLKPSNILVGKDGEPRLLDFGIAKLLEPGALELTWLGTEHGAAPLTPEYASPEQLSGRPVNALSDVYSLGVVLYRLLTGALPFTLTGLRLDQVVAMVCEREPQRPSERVERALARELRGDLDTIVLKALRKEPERRYGSVEQLAEDLRAHLDQRPIRARPDTLAYRTGKFVRRHRWAVAAASTGFGVLLGLLAVLWQQRGDLLERQRQLIRERQRAETVSDYLDRVFSMADPSEARGRQVTARELLEQGATEVERRLAGEPIAQAEVLLRMGRSYKNLGLYGEARPLLERARGLLAKAPTGSRALASVLHELADVASHAGRYAEAESLERAALAERRRAKPEPDAGWVESYGRLARALDLGGRPEAARPIYLEAVALARRLGEPGPLAGVLLRFAGLERRQGRRAEAEGLIREALALQRASLGADHPELGLTANDLGVVLLELGRHAAADALFAEAEALQRRLYGDRHAQLAVTLGNRGLSAAEQGRAAAAEQLFEQALAVERAVFGGDEHPQIATTLQNYGDLRRGERRLSEAEALYRRALGIQRRLLPLRHPDTAATANDLGLVLLARGRLAEAEPLFVEALETTRATLGAAHGQAGVILNNLGYLAEERGDLAAARARYEEALAVVRALPAAKPQEIAVALNNLGGLERSLGDLASAERRFREALDLLREGLGEQHLNVAMVKLSLAQVRLDAGHRADAEGLARDALAVFERTLAADDPWRASARAILARSLR